MKVALVSGRLSGHLVTLCNAPGASSEACREQPVRLYMHMSDCTFKKSKIYFLRVRTTV